MISLKQLLTKLTLTSNPAGTILAFYGTSAPSGYLVCDGSSFDTEKYAKLYQILGSSTLPDLRGRVLAGYNSSDTDTSETFGIIGSTGGRRGAWYHNHYTVLKEGGRPSGTSASLGYAFHVDKGAKYTSASGDSSNQLAAAKANMPPYVVINYIISTGGVA